MFRVLLADGIRVYWDRQSLRGDERLVPALDAAISQSSVAVIILTNAAHQSTWVEFELDVMLRQRNAGRLHVRGLLLDATAFRPTWLTNAELIVPRDPCDVADAALQVRAQVKRLLALC